MKTKYLIGNIKMNMDKESLIPYFENIREIAENSNNVVGVCVPSVYLDLAERYLNGSKVWYGAQNFYFEDKGTYTGEISGNMLKDFNAHMVIVGHSERRAMFNETNEDVNKKIKKALSLGLKPILCFGETRDERMSGKEKDVVKTQLFEALKDIEKEQLKEIIFAYEPVWAISCGIVATNAKDDVAATSDIAEEMLAYAKGLISQKYNVKNDEIIMLYGGSMKPSNALELLSQKDIDGGLIGGACLKFDTFKGVIDVEIE